MALLLCECSYYGVNKETSQIATISVNCVLPSNSSKIWDQMKALHPCDSIVLNGEGLDIIELIENRPFETEVYYFPSEPAEYIAISKNHNSIRYIYNSQISEDVLDGYSKLLDDDQRKRLKNRIESELLVLCENK